MSKRYLDIDYCLSWMWMACAFTHASNATEFEPLRNSVNNWACQREIQRLWNNCLKYFVAACSVSTQQSRDCIWFWLLPRHTLPRKTQERSSEGGGGGGGRERRANATEFGGETHPIGETFGSCGLCKCFPSVQTHCSQSSDSGQMFLSSWFSRRCSAPLSNPKEEKHIYKKHDKKL